MQKIAILSAIMISSASLLAADAAKDEVTSAAKKLGEKSYTWTTTVDVPEGTRFRPGPTEGKTEQNGFTLVSMTFGETTMQAAMKGEKSALRTDEGWQSLSEMDADEGRGRFRAMMLRNIRLPAAQVPELVAATKSLKKEGAMVAATKDLKQEGALYTGELTEEGARALLAFRRGAGGPTISNPKGSVKFWIRDGVLTKYETDVKGTMTFNENDVQLDRTTTVEIKEIGTTKVEVPEEAKQKLS